MDENDAAEVRVQESSWQEAHVGKENMILNWAMMASPFIVSNILDIGL